MKIKYKKFFIALLLSGVFFIFPPSATLTSAFTPLLECPAVLLTSLRGRSEPQDYHGSGQYLLQGIIPYGQVTGFTADQIIFLTNQIRAKHQLAPLIQNDQLNKSAQLKAQDMLTNQYFSHQNNQGKLSWELFDQENFAYRSAGENLAINFKSAQAVIDAWMDSPNHRENILDPAFQEVGVAVISGLINQRNYTIIVEHFGSQL